MRDSPCSGDLTPFDLAERHLRGPGISEVGIGDMSRGLEAMRMTADELTALRRVKRFARGEILATGRESLHKEARDTISAIEKILRAHGETP